MPKVAYQGEPGAYSERAVKVLFSDAEPLACETIRLTFSRVTSGEADFGVVPVENSQAGSVNESYDLLLRSSLVRVVGEVVLRVDHALLGPTGARLEGVRRAYSHWQALAQCEEFLTTHHIDPVPVGDTAGGARLVSERGSLDLERSPEGLSHHHRIAFHPACLGPSRADDRGAIAPGHRRRVPDRGPRHRPDRPGTGLVGVAPASPVDARVTRTRRTSCSPIG